MTTQLTTAERDLLDQANDAMEKLVASRKKQPRAATLRTAIPKHSYAPVDGFEPELKKMRAELAAGKATIPAPICPCDDPAYRPGNGSAPDSYKLALDRLKKGQNR